MGAADPNVLINTYAYSTLSSNFLECLHVLYGVLDGKHLSYLTCGTKAAVVLSAHGNHVVKAEYVVNY